MYGGLLKSASALAIVAAAGLFSTSVKAADLGGDCCADLEERVAELEATTVRKGNRKVSLSISGYVSQHVMWWDDGTQTDTYFADGGNNGSRWRFTGSAKVSPEITAGFLYEFQAVLNNMLALNQLNGGDDLGAAQNTIRDTTVWIRHKRLGMVKTGQGSTATDNLILIDLGGRGVAGTPDTALWNGGFLLRGNNGLLANSTTTNWAQAFRGNESFDTSRRNHVLYETPTLAGFTLQAAVAEDNFWDVALRYAGEFAGFRVAFGIGYQEDSEFNGGSQIGAGTFGVLCATHCNVESKDIKGSGSILHVATGLFVTGSGGNREITGSRLGTAATQYTGPDLQWWALSGGITQNFFGIGKTVLFGEYVRAEGGLEQGTFLGTQTGSYLVNEGGARSNSEAKQWGFGIVQNIDAAAMEIFATYKNYELEATGFTGANASLNKGAGGVSDFQTVIVGTRINF